MQHAPVTTAILNADSFEVVYTEPVTGAKMRLVGEVDGWFSDVASEFDALATAVGAVIGQLMHHSLQRERPA